MRSLWVGGLLGAALAGALVGACAIDESGTASDGGSDVIFGADVHADGLVDSGIPDVTYDVPDLGVGETESGLPCTCVTSIPGGYSVVEYDPTSRTACTMGYGGALPLIEKPEAGSMTCSCTCAPTPKATPTCTCGTSPATFNIVNGNGSCSNNALSLLSDPTCYTTPQLLAPMGQGLNSLGASPASPCTAAGACNTPSATATIPAPTSAQGESCGLDASLGGGCSGVCIPSTDQGFKLCVTNHTLAPCTSADFPYTHLVGTGITDTRGCGPSPCTTCDFDGGSCGPPLLELFNTNLVCGGTPDEVLDAGCQNVGFGNSQTFASTRYVTPEMGGACSYGGQFYADGGLSPTGAYNICCHN